MSDSLFSNLLPNALPQKRNSKTIKFADCHPERKHQAHGLCKRCYNKSRYTRKPKIIKMAKCHPDRKYYSKGLCLLCYERNRLKLYRTNPANLELIREKQRIYKQKQRDLNPEKRRADRHAEKARRKGCEGSYTDTELKELKLKYKNCCLCCGKNEEELALYNRTIVPDHVYPLLPKIGPKGTNYIWNIQPLCHGRGGCNNTKHNRYKDYRPVEDQKQLLEWLKKVGYALIV